MFLNLVWSVPLKIIVALVLLVFELKESALAGKLILNLVGSVLLKIIVVLVSPVFELKESALAGN